MTLSLDKDLYEQYLKVLDERDAYAGRVEELEKEKEDLLTTIKIYAAIVEDMPTDDLFEIYEEEMREDDLVVLGMCVHGVNLDRDFCEQGCRV